MYTVVATFISTAFTVAKLKILKLLHAKSASLGFFVRLLLQIWSYCARFATEVVNQQAKIDFERLLKNLNPYNNRVDLKSAFLVQL